MTTTLLPPEATATVDTTDVDIEDGSTTLDSAAVPYASATLTLPLVEDELIEWLDPREGVRVPYTATLDGVATRTFDLGLRGCRVDHAAKTVTLRLESDEAMLMRYAPLSVDEGAREHETSVRAICDYVLGKIGAALEAGTDDADVSAAWLLTNLVMNPAADTTTGYVLGTNAGSLGVGASSPFQGAGYVRWVGVAAGTTFLAVPISDTRVKAGDTFTFNGYMRASAAGQQGRLYVQFKDSAGAVVGNGALSGLVGLATGTGWSEMSLTFTVPEGVVSAQPFAVGSGAAGTTYALDATSYYEGNEFVDFFFGSSVADSFYTYAWVGTAGNSPSTRTPIISRPPALFLWQPGTSAWDFLVAITAAAGLVLWCDELRRWWLATPESRTIVTLVSVTASNVEAGTGDIDLDDDETTPTGVVVHYTWTDPDGTQREAYDAAGTSERVLKVEMPARAYPGPGTAAAILARRQGSGRRQDVTVVGQIDTTPGMTALISLPGAPDTTGRVARVTFNHKTGFMDLSAAGLIDIIPGSIAALLGTIDSLAGTIDSL